MPAVSEKQRRAAGMALGAKLGRTPVSKLQGAAKQMYDSMSEDDLRDFARKAAGLSQGIRQSSTLSILDFLKEGIFKFPQGEVEVSFKARGDAGSKMADMLDYIGRTAAVGHSFGIVVDPDATESEGSQRRFGMDGDGADHLTDVKVNGKKVPREYFDKRSASAQLSILDFIQGLTKESMHRSFHVDPEGVAGKTKDVRVTHPQPKLEEGSPRKQKREPVVLDDPDDFSHLSAYYEHYDDARGFLESVYGEKLSKLTPASHFKAFLSTILDTITDKHDITGDPRQ